MLDLLATYFIQRTSLSGETFKSIASHFKSISARKNELLLRQGDICKNYYFVNKGCIRLFTVNDDGSEATRYFAFEGAFGTALPSFIQQKPAFEFIQAIERSELLSISRTDFYYLVDTVPAMAAIYRQILELGFIAAQQRIYGFQTLTAIEKVKFVASNQPTLLARVSNKMAASFLGIDPSTLSRLKVQLNKSTMA